MEGLNWTFPYFSGAANVTWPLDWRISPADYGRVSGMSVSEYLAYRHRSTDVSVPNVVNNYGYVLLVYVARSVFPWMGEGNAIVALQLLVHVLVVLATLSLLETTMQRAVFFLCFGVNPVVLHVVTFPFYYFWTVIPPFFVALAWYRVGRPEVWAWLGAILLFLVVLTRPVTVFVSGLSFVVLYWRTRSKHALFAGLLFAGLCIVFRGGSVSPVWHTAFVGIGAYENSEGIELSDESAYAHYREATGVAISTNPVTGNLRGVEERSRYYAFLKGRYLAFLGEHPLRLARNAVFNLVQSFGLGFSTKSRALNVVSGVIGVAIGIAVVWTGQWVWGVGILAYSVAFAPYFPPIPAYLFGAYFFTSLILAGLAEKVRVTAFQRVNSTRPEFRWR